MSKAVERLSIEYENHFFQLELVIDESFRPSVIDEVEFDEQDHEDYENGTLVSYQLLIRLGDKCVYIPTVILERENPVDQLDILFSESDILDQFFKYFNIEVQNEGS